MKNIDPDAIALMLFPIEILGGLEEALRELFQKLPEKEGGTPVEEEDFVAAGVALYYDSAKPLIQSMLKGQLPDVSEVETDEPEPDPAPVLESNFIEIQNTGAKMSWNGEPYDKFVFPKCGPEYTTKSFELIFSDGNRLMVSDPKQMRMTGDNMKYQPGGRWSGSNPDIPTMEVYARKGTHPDSVKAIFRHKVDTTPVEPTEPTEPTGPEDGWTRIMWGGKDPDPSHDRAWWSCTDHPCRVWVRQFELPSSFPTSGSATFRFSNGYVGRVPDLSARTKYLDCISGSGKNVKYVKGQPNHAYVYDRKSDIAAPEGVKVEWMEYKV